MTLSVLKLRWEQTDIHWIGEELLKKREEVFIEVMKKVMDGIEKEV